MPTKALAAPPHQNKPPELKNDKYRRIRGGSARLLSLFCAKCEAWLMLYQKDGDGALLRCYLNRIFDPPKLEKLQHDASIREPRDLPLLKCPTCQTVIGFPARHHDGRLAFRLAEGAVQKRRATHR